MSATESREVLEAVLWRALTACHVRGTPVCGCKANVTAILGLADAYRDTVPQPPHWAGLTAEDSCGATDIPDHSDGLDYICTSQDGHAMPHLAHDADGRIMHAWDDGRPW